MGRRRTKTTTAMERGGITRLILIPCTLIAVVSLVYLIWFLNSKNSTYSNIEYIKSFMTSSGNLNDFQNKLGMHDPATDIKWYKTDKEIRIEFGRVFLTWEPKDFYQKENLELLETIGITAEIQEDADGEKVLHIYYKGVELERWVK